MWYRNATLEEKVCSFAIQVYSLKLDFWLICCCDDRWTLEQNGLLEPRKSVLEDDFEEEEEKEENEGIADGSEDEKVVALTLQ